MASCTCHTETVRDYDYGDGKRGTLSRRVQCDACIIAALNQANSRQQERIWELEAEVDKWRSQVQPGFYGGGSSSPEAPRMRKGDRK